MLIYRAALILGGDYYTGTVLASTLTKIVLRFAELSQDQRKVNELRAEVCSAQPSCLNPSTYLASTGHVDNDFNDPHWSISLLLRPHR